MSATAPASPPRQACADNPEMMLIQMIHGYWISQILHVAVELRLPDLMKNGPETVEALAEAAGADTDGLYRLLRVLDRMGVVSEAAPKTFQLTEMGGLLRSDVPRSLAPMARMSGEEHYHAWGKLLHGIKTGGSPFEAAYGMHVFEYFQQNPQAGEIFNAAMTSYSETINSAVLDIYDFSKFSTVVDVGGGHGRLLAKILKKHPNLQGVVFDLPHVVNRAETTFREAGVAERAKAVSGDFFQAVHPGGDAYVLSRIVHDWRDDLAVNILKSVRAAIRPDGRLLLVDEVIDPASRDMTGPLMDLNMLVMTPGGRERTEAEFSAVLEQAGFRLLNVHRTPTGVCIVEAEPA